MLSVRSEGAVLVVLLGTADALLESGHQARGMVSGGLVMPDRPAVARRPPPNGDEPDQRSKRWKPAELGRSVCSGSSASLGKGDDALPYLHTLLDRYVEPDGMYRELGAVLDHCPML